MVHVKLEFPQAHVVPVIVDTVAVTSLMPIVELSPLERHWNKARAIPVLTFPEVAVTTFGLPLLEFFPFAARRASP
eukprot:9284662-Karenia_brevis.AAC.1